MPSTLRITLSAVGTGCQQDPTPPAVFPRPGIYAFLLDCNGSPVIKAGQEQGAIAFDHGYAEVRDIDPGRYIVLVMVNPFATGGASFQSNMVSLHAIEVCGCCETQCVRIYQTGWHQCFRVNVFALQFLGRAQVLKPDVVERAVTALQEALAVGMPQPADAAILRTVGQVADMFQALKPPA